MTAAMLLWRDPYSLFYYGDAVSHLVIARRIIDWIQPGFVQIGSVWLPMTHVLLLPFVASDFLFRTGLAGTIVSGVSTAVTTVALFKILRFHFDSTRAGFLGASLFVLNPSVIYIGTVAMMEAPFMMFFVLSLYYFQQWFHSETLWKQYRNIMKCALAISGATLTRYEGWILPVASVFILAMIMTIVQKERWAPRREAFLSVAVTYSSLGMITWIVWNVAIFRDPLYFANAPYYSAAQQALVRDYRQHLFLQPLNSVSIMLNVAGDMYGSLVVMLAILGVAAALLSAWRKRRLSYSLLVLVLFLSPLIANYAALVQGSGEIYPVAHGYFNGRYLVFAAPFIAYASTSLVMFVAERRTKVLTLAVTILVIGAYGANFQSQFFSPSATVAMSGTVLPYDYQYQVSLATGKEIGGVFPGGRVVMYTTAQEGQEMMISSGLPLKDFIDVNAGAYWRASESQPWNYGSCLVIAKDVWAEDVQLLSYWTSNAGSLQGHFNKVFENEFYVIYLNNNATTVQSLARGFLPDPGKV